MQSRNEQIIKIAKDLSFIKAKAFKPSTSAVVTFLPFNFGGVFGDIGNFLDRGCTETLYPCRAAFHDKVPYSKARFGIKLQLATETT